MPHEAKSPSARVQKEAISPLGSGCLSRVQARYGVQVPPALDSPNLPGVGYPFSLWAIPCSGAMSAGLLGSRH